MKKYIVTIVDDQGQKIKPIHLGTIVEHFAYCVEEAIFQFNTDNKDEDYSE